MGKRRKMTEGREETSNPGEKPFFVEPSHMKRFQTKCQKLPRKATYKDFIQNKSETTQGKRPMSENTKRFLSLIQKLPKTRIHLLVGIDQQQQMKH